MTVSGRCHQQAGERAFGRCGAAVATTASRRAMPVLKMPAARLPTDAFGFTTAARTE